MSETLIRANKVSVKASDDGFVASFYRTHKLLGEINSIDTGWEKPDYVSNKVGERESFREYIIKHAEQFGINWSPKDMRTEDNKRRPKYESDEVLIQDAMSMLIPELQALVEKCKYDIEWGGLAHEDIVPVTQTSMGKDLSTLGIHDGRYSSGNWAWADIKFVMTFKYKGSECYLSVTMKLVSGQLKKVGIGITTFNSAVKYEIVSAGLATEEELDPPKESKPINKAKQDDTEVRIDAYSNRSTEVPVNEDDYDNEDEDDYEDDEYEYEDDGEEYQEA